MDLEHEKRLTTVETRSESNERRIEEVEKRQTSLETLTSTVKVLAEREERVENDVKEIKSDVKTINAKAGKRWESLVSQIITILVAAVIGFILAKIGL